MLNYKYWIPRILGIIFILFISIFAFDTPLGIGFLIHLIPSFVLIGILIVAWKWELIGGSIFLVLGIIFTIFFNTYREIIHFLLISFPVFLIGGLFIFSKLYKK